MRMRRKKNLLPRIERASEVLIKEPEVLKGSWLAHFPEYRAIHIELGCGKGRFTIETAKSIPDVLIIAVERYKDVIVTAMERTLREELPNIRFLNIDAEKLCEVFDASEAERIYINFCDPWPTKRHEKRRLTSPLFLKRYLTVLKPGGEIHFKTDNLELFRYSVRQLGESGFKLTNVSEHLHRDQINGIMTDYEEKFHLEGKPICRLEASKEHIHIQTEGAGVL